MLATPAGQNVGTEIPFPLFFGSLCPGESRIPAAEEWPFADNFLQKQQKQRNPFEKASSGKLCALLRLGYDLSNFSGCPISTA
jgi:hypothetical protein